MNLILSFLTLTVAPVLGYYNSNFEGGRQGIVHLFEWKWLDIAQECEDFLGPKGYGGVQTSPVNENAIVPGRPWFERYQPISYKLTTRSGNEEEFREMVQRCRISGVRIFVDIIVNHMARQPALVTGTAGSNRSDPSKKYYPAVPYNSQHFHPTCYIYDYSNATNVRACELESLPDLDQSNIYVRQKIVAFMNHLIDLGVAGFRIDAAKHMSPADLGIIFGSIKPLSSENGFIDGKRAFMYQEVSGKSFEAIQRQEYILLGTVTEFAYSELIGKVFRKMDADLSILKNWGTAVGFLPSLFSLAFVDNHDNQREENQNSTILTYKQKDLYIKAVVFMLAHPHGENHPQIISSYAFSSFSQGPPQDSDENIISPQFDDQNQCTNGWVCEHRWAPIGNMIKFRAATHGTPVKAFTNIAKNQISFCRGLKGFIAINNSDEDLDSTLTACVPDGQYCDVISGDLVNGSCTGTKVTVKAGKAYINIPVDSVGIVAIHVNAKLSN